MLIGMILFWSLVFIASLVVVVKGSDYLLIGAEKIGLRAGLSPFIVGVTIVGIGTSLPELVSSLVAVSKGVTDVVVGNAVGSNIANILLIGGFAALITKGLKAEKDIVDLDIPLLALVTAIFYLVAKDGSVVLMDSIILVVTYGVYLLYTLIYKEEGKAFEEAMEDAVEEKVKVTTKDMILLVLGIVGLAAGAKYLIESITELAVIFNIAPGLIAVSAVAIGTSLPELLVSVKAAARGQAEVALGNIFGSNLFNLLMVVGIPGLFGNLLIDEKTFTIGIPMLLIATTLFIISGISKSIHRLEAIMFLLIYLIFTAQLFGWM